MKQKNLYQGIIKPIADWLAALFLFIITMPLQFLIFLSLLFLNRKVFFFQSRLGKHNKLFVCIKFYTINDDGTSSSFQQFLRKYSLDELPQLLNILKGEMSLVGPRPLLPEYQGRFNDKHEQRHQVKPGLTGLVQISGRNELNWEERLDLDVKYFENISFLLDLKILIKTVRVIFQSKGTGQSEPFQGYQ